MNSITKSRNSYLRKYNFWHNKSRNADKKIDELKKQIVLQEIIISKCYTKSPFWAEEMVRPIIDEIAKRLNLIHDSERLVPMGMKARVSVFFFRKTKNGKQGKLLYSLTFVPKEDGLMNLETGQPKNKSYASGSLGDLNGFNIIEIPCPDSISKIIQFMKNKKSWKKFIKEGQKIEI